MIKFSNWNIEAIGQALGRQYDNLTRELRVEGIIPEGWTWDLLVQAGKNLDIIRLNQGGNRLSVMLTSEMLALAGYYFLQLRATQGEKVRHTNVIQVVVPTSLVGDATWPELPSEFSQAEANIRALNAHPPYAGSNGYWMIWDLETGDYVESQLSLPEVSVGPQGPEGKAASIRVGSVLTGEPGSQAAVSNSGTENNAILDFVLPRGQIGPTGPSGADGRDGKDGVPGAAATIRVGAVTTGEPGTQAQVVNVGTENAAVLQFTIPQGRPGADGMNGKDGQDGAPGPAGVGVPEISDGDEGKVMTARSGKAVWETAQGGGGGNVQPDWDQNDSQAADFIKNRPFYYQSDATFFEIDGVTLTLNEEFGVYEAIVDSVQIVDGLKDKETYKVTVNGYPYTLQAKYSENQFLFGEETGDPFLLMLSYKLDGSTVFGFGSVTDMSPVSVSVTGPITVPIDPKFLSRAGEAGFAKLEDISHGVSTGDDDPYTVSVGSGQGRTVFKADLAKTELASLVLGGNEYKSYLVLDVSQNPTTYSAKLGVGYAANRSASYVLISNNKFEVVLNGKPIFSARAFYQNDGVKVSWPIAMQDGHTVTNLPDPVETSDAVPKSYVDAKSLPAYTSDDEGKVLKIVDGVPTWVTP